jgi:hypothetical protein
MSSAGEVSCPRHTRTVSLVRGRKPDIFRTRDSYMRNTSHMCGGRYFVIMITFLTYREASFKGIAATDAAIQQALDCGWSVSKLREVRPGEFVVLFRHDQDCPSAVPSASRPELPLFDHELQAGHRSVGLTGALAGRLWAVIRSRTRHAGTGAMPRGAS